MKKTSDNIKVWFLYFIRNAHWVYKIWITKNLWQRLRQYNLWNEIDLKHIFIAKLYEYWKAEREVINYFKTLPNTFKNEWSILSDIEAENVINIALKYKWAIVFNDLEVWRWYFQWDNLEYLTFPNWININKLVNNCNNFFKTIDFS